MLAAPESISKMTTKCFRLTQTSDEDKVICLYKLGLVLDPGEVLAWTSKIRKLTGTRHKNILLRVVHGDIFSNARLHKFRLRDTSACANCPDPVETILHRITDCPRAHETWRIANEARDALGIVRSTNFSIENLIGIGDRQDKIELAINAEIIHRLTTKGE